MLDYIPNQKIVKINREKVEKVAAQGRLYLIVYQDNLLYAMKSLSHTAFKVYMFFLFNKDNYSIAYSPEYIHKQANICKETARKAFKELQEKGYIIKSDRGLEFYEYPKAAVKLLPIGDKKEFVDNETGEVFNYSYNQLVAIVGKEKADYLWDGDSNVGE